MCAPLPHHTAVGPSQRRHRTRVRSEGKATRDFQVSPAGGSWRGPGGPGGCPAPTVLRLRPQQSMHCQDRRTPTCDADFNYLHLRLPNVGVRWVYDRDIARLAGSGHRGVSPTGEQHWPPEAQASFCLRVGGTTTVICMNIYPEAAWSCPI